MKVASGVNIPMAQPAKATEERRRVERLALRLTATMRDGTKSRVKARVIDMSTNGCRIECSSSVEDDSWVWLSIAGLETQFSRVVWHCGEFIGLEFEKPLAEAVFERLLADQDQVPEGTINELRSIAAARIAWPGRPRIATSPFLPNCRASARWMRWSPASGAAVPKPRLSLNQDRPFRRPSSFPRSGFGRRRRPPRSARQACRAAVPRRTPRQAPLRAA